MSYCQLAEILVKAPLDIDPIRSLTPPSQTFCPATEGFGAGIYLSKLVGFIEPSLTYRGLNMKYK